MGIDVSKLIFGLLASAVAVGGSSCSDDSESGVRDGPDAAVLVDGASGSIDGGVGLDASSSAHADATSTPGPQELEATLAIMAAWCEAAIACPEITADGFVPIAPVSLCASVYTDFWSRWNENFDDSSKYQPNVEAFAECAEGLGQACDGRSPLVACREHLGARLELGDCCEADVECSSGLVCACQDEGCSSRACAEASSLGEACGAEALCDAGLFCSETEVCEPRRRLGESCSASRRECTVDVGLESFSVVSCADDGTCRADDAPAGGSCEDINDCRGDQCTPDGVCVGPLASGASCIDPTLGDGVSRGGCFLGFTCVAGECTPTDLPTEGEACDPDDLEFFQFFACVPFHEQFCGDDGTGTFKCQQRRSQGEDCSTARGGDQSACEPGLRCDFDERICVPRPVECQ